MYFIFFVFFRIISYFLRILVSEKDLRCILGLRGVLYSARGARDRRPSVPMGKSKCLSQEMCLRLDLGKPPPTWYLSDLHLYSCAELIW